MELIQLNIRGISHNQVQAGAYALLLEEKSGKIKIPIIIGILEAQSIASALEKHQHIRPFTHDLFVNFAKNFDFNIKSIIIYKIYDGIFFSRIIFEKLCNEKIQKEIDSRTSDAIALAIRFKSTIYATKEVCDQAGIHFEHYFALNNFKQDIKNDLKKLKLEDLQNLLKQAVLNEEYEFASHIKKEIDNRKLQ
ncbi:MAG: bifunctional nuclease family protein [Candidatus Bostrichicola ureolyticus]|nr:MAG: bifunctional nuclease family protein [Candidatus Bostrichicola ureolyticus]